jgi:hypothetical protein
MKKHLAMEQEKEKEKIKVQKNIHSQKCSIGGALRGENTKLRTT